MIDPTRSSAPRKWYITVTVSPEEAARERMQHWATDKGWLPDKSCCNCGRKWPCLVVRLLDLRDQADNAVAVWAHD